MRKTKTVMQVRPATESELAEMSPSERRTRRRKRWDTARQQRRMRKAHRRKELQRHREMEAEGRRKKLLSK